MAEDFGIFNQHAIRKNLEEINKRENNKANLKEDGAYYFKVSLPKKGFKSKEEIQQFLTQQRSTIIDLVFSHWDFEKPPQLLLAKLTDIYQQVNQKLGDTVVTKEFIISVLNEAGAKIPPKH